MFRHLVLSTFILLAGSEAIRFIAAGATQSPRAPESEEYDVYSALLQKLFVNERTKLVVIQEKTIDGQILEPMFRLKVKCVVITKTELDRIFANNRGGWTAFYNAYPDSAGYLGLSSVRFNAEMNAADIAVQVYCGWHCGSGLAVHLVKTNGAWVVQRKELRWVS